MRFVFFFISLCIFLISPVVAQDEPTTFPTQGWQTTSPEAQGMNSETLAAMLNQITQQRIDIHSVLITRNGYLVLEAYRAPYTADNLHEVYSVTKSVTSALFGVAIDQGYIGELDQPMLDFFPGYKVANLDNGKNEITLQNLLTMTSGLEWRGGIEEPMLSELTTSSDWIQFMLNLPMADDPGKTFVYNTGVSNLLAAIIANTTELPLLDYARANLFDPLGIPYVEWATDPHGYYTGGFGLKMTPRDMAKFGYLYLNNGQWVGQQIVSGEWVNASMQPYINARPVADYYGYQWWVDLRGYYMAVGFGGQYIIVYPPENLVVVFTSALAAAATSQPETLFGDYILPSVISDEALPEDSTGTALLELAINTLQDPEPLAIPPLPTIATQISDEIYTLESNDFGWEKISFHFSQGADSAEMLLNDQPPISIGLDAIPRISPLEEGGIGYTTGHWQTENRFITRLEFAGSVNWVQLTFTFEDDEVQVVFRDGISGFSRTFKGTAG